MKIYFKFDKASVPETIIKSISESNKNLVSFDGEVFSLNFDPVVFTHAWQLLSRSPTRFGSDLSPYLACTYDFFQRASTDALCLTVGTTDFKRRMSEDLGVALASLFMVDSFGVEWHTIAQIPDNRNISKTRPDFEAFDPLGNRYLYEAKGRSTLDGVLPAIDKALSQVKSYPEAANRKLAFVTYFCTDERAFPSHTFMLDPQLPDTILPDKNTAEQLHILNILDFGGLSESRKAYITLLKARFSLLAARAAGTDSFAHENRAKRAVSAFSAAYDQEASSMADLIFANQQFKVRTTEVSADKQIFTILTGVHIGTKDRAISGDTAKQVESFDLDNLKEGVSVFSDGTIFKISAR